MKERPIFVLSLQAERGTDGERALRAALKRLLRDHGLRCIAVTEQPAPLRHSPANREKPSVSAARRAA